MRLLVALDGPSHGRSFAADAVLTAILNSDQFRRYAQLSRDLASSLWAFLDQIYSSISCRAGLWYVCYQNPGAVARSQANIATEQPKALDGSPVLVDPLVPLLIGPGGSFAQVSLLGACFSVRAARSRLFSQ